MKVTALTTTGSRPEAMSFCCDYILRQTRQPDQWIVVDDGAEPLPVRPAGCTYIRREPREDDPPHTLTRNWLAAIPHIEGDVVVVAEDDDWVKSTYISEMCAVLENADIAGECCALYYNVAVRKWVLHGNYAHASLCSTAFRRELLDAVSVLCASDDPLLDIRLWRYAWENGMRRYLRVPTRNDRLVVGIKGMPGRKGIGFGHAENWSGWNDDAMGDELVRLVRLDALWYTQFYRGAKGPQFVGVGTVSNVRSGGAVWPVSSSGLSPRS